MVASRSAGNNSIVQNCTVTNIGYGFGIITDQANNVLLKGNTISNIHGQGNAEHGHGIYIADNTVGAVLDGNIIQQLRLYRDPRQRRPRR